MNASSPSAQDPANLPRVEQVTVDGTLGWCKRKERLAPRMRLQKGDAALAFEAERAFFIAHEGKGLPIPKLLDYGADFFVTADSGTTLLELSKGDADAMQHALCDAARALGQLHASGISHGRPALKDICWEAGQIAFIDWERYRPSRNTQANFALDVVLFFFSAVTVLEGAGPAVEAARQEYLANAPADIWPRAAKRVRRLRPLRFMLSPVIKRMQAKREFRAVDPFFDFMRPTGKTLD